MNPIEFSKHPDPFSVTYTSPSRNFKNLREEFQFDAFNISKEYGQVYVAFSSGVDSQIIARSFIDMKCASDVEFVFLHIKGVNETELEHVKECEKILNIKVRIVTLDLIKVKEKWIKEDEKNPVTAIAQFPFRYLSEKLKEKFPIITQGSVEPAIVGSFKENAAIYHNRYEAMELRFRLVEKKRKIIDFPYSAESVASYYTDPQMKLFVNNLKYFWNNSISVEPSQFFNTYAKPFVKGQYYKDILWFGKLTGLEKAPLWLRQTTYVKETRVTVPYWDLVDFLENTRNEKKTYSEWLFPNR